VDCGERVSAESRGRPSGDLHRGRRVQPRPDDPAHAAGGDAV